ncbi:MAG: excinuclease ABC subunit C [Bacteroidetes bacterium CG2_30_33_31]|nr:MAG: excinuclease ABC subunit C [Bacteroidetes bacterium CG2_30_33_31]
MAEANPKYQQNISSILQTLPTKPGVYQYFDDKGKIIYIGKAKSLKSRVSSYFNRDANQGAKINFLVRKIADIKVIVVNTEIDALLLENNLIKKHQPRYNIMLKDDKTYPWICVKNEAFPRVFSTRYMVKDGSQYFGPYASGKMMHTILELVYQLFPIRTCKLNLSKKNIEAGKFNVCLEYHIGNCLGGCVERQTEENYDKDVKAIKELLRGNILSVIKSLKELMMDYAGNLEFEKAQKTKEKIAVLENYQSKSSVVSSTISDADVFSIDYEQDTSYVNYMKVVSGAVVQSHSVELTSKLEETKEEVISHAIIDLRTRFYSNSAEIILPFEIDIELPGVKFYIPQRGDKKTLLELSERNAKFFKLDLRRKRDLVDPERHSKRILEQLCKDLRMTELPNHIECFDNSNIQGTNAVASCVVFKNAKPSKNDYRHFNIKTVVGPDDFASMEEIILRRYSRLLAENKSIPQLIIIDGGKGQLSAAMKSITKLGLRNKIRIIGIAKKLEEIYFPGDTIPLYLNKKSESLKLIQQARDEAHRFGITHHRNKRSKSMTNSELTNIEGIGDKTLELLLKKFKSVKRIKTASKIELTEVIGEHRASLVNSYFNKL